MASYLSTWAGKLLQQDSIILTSPIPATGERDKHLGPRRDFAKVALMLKPSSNFEVVDRVPNKNELENLGVGWPEAVIYGVLDILVLVEPGPLLNVSVVLEEAWYSEIDSSYRAFRLAGRDAARKAFDNILENKAWKFELEALQRKSPD